MSFQFSFLQKPAQAANPANLLTEHAGGLTPVSGLAELAAEDDSEAPEQAGIPAKYKALHTRLRELGLADAGELAIRLHARDLDLDDRRLCVECAHFRAKGCAVNGPWLPRDFQRCERFRLARY